VEGAAGDEALTGRSTGRTPRCPFEIEYSFRRLRPSAPHIVPPPSLRPTRRLSSSLPSIGVAETMEVENHTESRCQDHEVWRSSRANHIGRSEHQAMVAVACGGVDEPAAIAGGWNQSESELATSMDWRYRSSSFRPFLLSFITSLQERDEPCTTNF
jgi:hypothetical protein